MYSNLFSKAGNQVQFLSRVSSVLNESNKMLVYSNFVESYFDYCIMCHFCSNSNGSKIGKLRKRSAIHHFIF